MNAEAGMEAILCMTDEAEWSEADFADDENPYYAETYDEYPAEADDSGQWHEEDYEPHDG